MCLSDVQSLAKVKLISVIHRLGFFGMFLFFTDTPRWKPHDCDHPKSLPEISVYAFSEFITCSLCF